MQIDQHCFIVTGGSTGLGAATARLLASLGARVLIADLNVEAGEHLAAQLGASARFKRADVTSESDMLAALSELKSEWGELHGVVHCAGIIGAARVLGKQGPHDLALFEKIVRVNLVGTFNVARLAAAAMAENSPGADGERGVIVMTSSVAAMEGQIGQAAYAASKGGVASLALPLARELARVGIRVVAIAPGAFATPMVLGLDATVQESLAAQVPFPPRLGRPEEFAALARHILENAMLNGSVIRLDGALRMAGK
jgi:NAD(P)-dependent dehydrogenase (short-subunit alcohol dehydrogenase family)